MLLTLAVAGAGTSRDGAADGAERQVEMPAWEGFIIVGFVGMALGLAIALPIYLRERWPRALEGRLPAGLPGPAFIVPPYLFRTALIGSLASGVEHLYSGAGGSVGAGPARCVATPHHLHDVHRGKHVAKAL